MRLTPTEYELLFELSVHAGRVLTHDRLLQRVWGLERIGEPWLVREVVKRLRRKLGDDANSPAYIFTEPRVGYRMAEGEAPGPESLQACEPPLWLSLDEVSDAMTHPDMAVVTGAFSYTGNYVARRLLKQGVLIRTLTRRSDRHNSFGGAVEAGPLDFSDPEGLRRSMEGADVFYNTYWIRFARGQITFDYAVENTKTLFVAAKRASVGRIVQFSVTNPSAGSRLPYFKGKVQVEDMLEGLGIPYAIIRPTLVFGEGDLLLNNIAWALRRFPVFPVCGSGDYQVQPVCVEDLAAQAVEDGFQSGSSVTDAAGPETFSFKALLRLLASSMGVRSRLVHTPPSLALALTGLVGLLMRDLALTRDEVDGLMAGLLTSDAAPTGTIRLSDWLDGNANSLGRRYTSELRRNYRG